jgi:hypothetical protein
MTINQIVALAVLGLSSVAGQAATTCVFNASAGKFESKGAFDFVAKECDFDKTLVSMLDVQSEIRGRGIVLANTAMLTDVANGVQKQTVSLSPDSADPAPMVRNWEVAATDVRLANTFERWAKIAGYNVSWDADRHVLISVTTSFTGTFEEAVMQALSTPGIRYSAYPLEACRYENKPPLIRITRQGEQAKECPDQY